MFSSFRSGLARTVRKAFAALALGIPDDRISGFPRYEFRMFGHPRLDLPCLPGGLLAVHGAGRGFPAAEAKNRNMGTCLMENPILSTRRIHSVRCRSFIDDQRIPPFENRREARQFHHAGTCGLQTCNAEPFRTRLFHRGSSAHA